MRSGSAQRLAPEKLIERGVDVTFGERHEDAFASRQSVDFDDRGILRLLQRRLRLIHRRARRRLGRRDVVFAHELLREDFRSFQLCGEAGRTENRKSALLEFVDDAEGERELGTDDGEVDFQFVGEIGQFDDVGDADPDAVCDRCDAGVSRSGVNLSDQRRHAS